MQSQEADDLHLLYATLFDQNNRSNPTYAVTNDFMRNHASSAFPSMQLFYRWRKTQVANYVIKSRVKPHQQHLPNELILSIPGRHHHSIQYTKENGHWHIPIIDRLNTWLCVSLEETPKASMVKGGGVGIEQSSNRNCEGSGGMVDREREYEWQGSEEEGEEEGRRGGKDQDEELGRERI